jgi:hypothetical protein
MRWSSDLTGAWACVWGGAMARESTNLTARINLQGFGEISRVFQR